MTTAPGPDDRHQIIEQLHLLASLMDHRLWDRFGEVFTADVDAYGYRGVDTVVSQCIRTHIGGSGPSQHLLGNHQIVVDGDRARSVSRARVFIQGAGDRGDRTWECFGEYHDGWARTPQGWRMTDRRFDMAMSFGDFDVHQPG